ncbi:MAG: protein phosphatase 2C domain-containing protein [Lachnospiraceae bacterium]|nr:protein phosphatase 2C domain-containing protein [Lachnospiraceae bacterium]
MLSEKGSRENNEDSIGMYQDHEMYCFILADGLGGHGKGEVASRTAVDAVIRQFATEEDRTLFLDKAFCCAQEAITEKQEKDHACRDMKTTLVVLHIGEDSVQWGHIGDSRLYFFENGKIQTRTLDHSVPQMLVAVGEIREKDIRHHPDRNRLLKVLGVEMDEMNHQLGEMIPRKRGQAFLLCSDGFWELIDEKKMEATLKKAKEPQEWLDSMEQIVLKNGKNTDMDNYSAVAVWFE